MKEYDKMSIKELTEELEKLGVSYKKSAKKAELIELLHTGAGKSPAADEAAARLEAKTVKKAAARVASDKEAAGSEIYAVVRTGGKQLQVATGARIKVEKITGEVGDIVVLSEVLLVADGQNIKIGQPLLAGAEVKAEIIEQAKAKKVLVFKKKRRKAYRVKRGHRQQYTALEIKEISL